MSLPVSSVDSLFSWGVYIISGAALLLALSPFLTSAVNASRQGADWRNVDGVRSVLDALQPGEKTTFSFGGSGQSDPIKLGAHQISCSYGGGSVIMEARMLLQNTDLLPLVQYTAFISGDRVVVTQVG